MHEIKEMIQKIVDDGDRHEMEELSDILEEIICLIKEYDENIFKKYKLQIYEMAYGKRLTDNMKRQWVEQMKPSAKWNEEEIREIVNNYGTDIPVLSVYVIMNMFYSDMRKTFGSAEDEESIERYIQGANDWYYDSDATNTEEAKLYCYWKYIVN